MHRVTTGMPSIIPNFFVLFGAEMQDRSSYHTSNTLVSIMEIRVKRRLRRPTAEDESPVQHCRDATPCMTNAVYREYRCILPSPAGPRSSTSYCTVAAQLSALPWRPRPSPDSSPTITADCPGGHWLPTAATPPLPRPRQPRQDHEDCNNRGAPWMLRMRAPPRHLRKPLRTTWRLALPRRVFHFLPVPKAQALLRMPLSRSNTA